MKSSMRSRLEHLCHRLIEVDAMLAEPDTASDMDRFRKLSRERARTGAVVEAFTAFVRSEEDLATAQEMLSDPDMKAMAEEEIKASRGKIEELEGALQRCCCCRATPMMAAACSWKSAPAPAAKRALFSGRLAAHVRASSAAGASNDVGKSVRTGRLK